MSGVCAAALPPCPLSHGSTRRGPLQA